MDNKNRYHSVEYKLDKRRIFAKTGEVASTYVICIFNPASARQVMLCIDSYLLYIYLVKWVFNFGTSSMILS